MTGIIEPEGDPSRRGASPTTRRVRVSRVLAGAVLAPVVPPLVHSLLSANGAVPGFGDRPFTLPAGLIAMSYGLSVPLGALLFAILHNRGRVAAPRVIGYAVLAGMAAGGVFGAVVSASSSVTPGAIVLFGVVGGIWALIVSAAFSAIAGIPLRRRAERSAP